MRGLSLLLVLSACATAPGSTPEATVGPLAAAPGALTLEATPLVPGAPVSFRITGGQPGGRVFLLRARNLGTTCAPQTAPDCIDISGNIAVIRDVVFDPSGTAVIATTLPATVPPGTIALQAVDPLNPGADTSNAILATIYDPAGDADGDGLSSFDEVDLHGTDPGVADSDGGGVDDGTEILVDGTDPLDPGDDLIGTVDPVDALAPGDLVVTEIHKDPDAVSDADGEWIEIRVDYPGTVDLGGLVVRDDTADTHTITGPLIVSSGDYVVLGRDTDPAVNGGAPVDYAYSNFVLANAEDEIVLENSGGEIFRVGYDDGIVWPEEAGRSLQLDLGESGAAAGLDPAAWCPTPDFQSYGAGDFGSPGADNTGCAFRGTTTYDGNISNLIDNNCTGCHTGGGMSGGRNFDTYAEMFQTSQDAGPLRLIDGTGLDPAASYLYLKLLGKQSTVPGGTGQRMPRGGPFFDSQQLERFRIWILEGVPEM